MMLNETLAEKKIHICIFPKSSQQRCNIFKNASIFLKNLGCNIYAFDPSFVFFLIIFPLYISPIEVIIC